MLQLIILGVSKKRKTYSISIIMFLKKDNIVKELTMKSSEILINYIKNTIGIYFGMILKMRKRKRCFLGG